MIQKNSRGTASVRRVIAWSVTVAALAMAAVIGAPTAATAADDDPGGPTIQACATGTRYGPYWWGNVNATNAEPGRKVLAIASPWGDGSGAYIWADNNDDRQRFWLECRGYDGDVSRYRFRYAHNTSLCLMAPNSNPGVRLRLAPCGEGLDLWEQWADGAATVDGTRVQTYRFKNFTNEMCIDVNGAGTANGIAVQLFTCKAGDHQRWF